MQSLIMVDCTGVKSPKTTTWRWRSVAEKLTQSAWSGSRISDNRIAYLFVRQPEIPAFIKRILVAQARERRAPHEAILAQTTPKVKALEVDLGRNGARTLIVWGEQRDCGLEPMSERPEETAAHVLRFLANGAQSKAPSGIFLPNGATSGIPNGG